MEVAGEMNLFVYQVKLRQIEDIGNHKYIYIVDKMLSRASTER